MGIPLFPLQVMLSPGVVLPLHIFESRSVGGQVEVHGPIGSLATGSHTVSAVAVDPSNNAAVLSGPPAITVISAPPPGWKGYIYTSASLSAGFGGQMVAQYKDSTTYFAHKDYLGSTRVLTRVDKTVYDSLDYLPYGEQIAGDTGTSHKFTRSTHSVRSGHL
jgi:hypothetical protein